ncbi:protein LYRIC [Manacus vitellinus]|uniref:protein LYRIC n=1 Tax=Manacus vitellinus TaxID=328815 RepID=UPI00115EECDE|nr:protein LYRIC [Manacus vitellinus]
MRAHHALRYMAELVIITAMVLDNDLFVTVPDNSTPTCPRHPRLPRTRPGPAGPPRPRGSAAATGAAPGGGERGSGTNFWERSGVERGIPVRGAARPCWGRPARLALGAGELPGRLLALLWPALVLAAAAAALMVLVLRGLRAAGAAPGPPARRAPPGRCRSKRRRRRGGGGGRMPSRGAAAGRPGRCVAAAGGKRRTAQKVPVNGQVITSVNIREKKLLKPKKKRKIQCSDKEVPKDLLSVEKDKLQEEEGVWQTKISSREKRHLRKERLKQKDPSRTSLGSSAVEPAFDWDEKGAVWPLTGDTSGGGKGALFAKAECGATLKASGATREESVPSRSEEDIFSNVGTWDIADVKSCPVTFGTLSDLSRDLDNVKSKSSEDSPSRCCWHSSSTFLPTDDVWQGQDDPSAFDLDSDWKAPMEEWGNWTGDEEHQTGEEKEKDLPKGKAGIRFCPSGLESKTQRKKKKMEVKEARGGSGLKHQGLQTRMEEGPRDLISTNYSSDAVSVSFKKSLDVANNSPSNGVSGKKERRKRKKMKKET